MGLTEPEDQVQQIVANRCRAVSEGDAMGIVRDVAENAVIFDVVGSMFAVGKSAALERAQQWLASYDGPPLWNVENLHVIAGECVAFCHCISRVRGTLKTQVEVDMWFRTTLGLKKSDDQWQIVHDHSSDPFDPSTGLATMEKPDQLP